MLLSIGNRLVPIAMQRLGRMAPLCRGNSSSLSADEPPVSAASPPTLLSDGQMKDYLMNGYLALPISDLTDEWHNSFWQRCHDWLFKGGEEPHTMPDGEVSRPYVYPDIPELCEVTLSPTVRGALTSILGPGYVQHPHRTMHNYGRSLLKNDQLAPIRNLYSYTCNNHMR